MPPRDETERDDAPSTAKTTLVALAKAFGGAGLRDVWVLDERAQEVLYVRKDVAETIEDVDVERYVDIERYGFAAHDTYTQLHYAEFGYTLRGFDSWELFRTFLVDGETKIGVLSSFDRRAGGYDYAWFNDEIQELREDYDVAAFSPATP